MLERTIVKLNRQFAGSYTCRVWYKNYQIERNNERGSTWFGQWIIRCITDGGYSDPIQTLRDCRNALQDMQDNPQMYGFELI